MDLQFINFAVEPPTPVRERLAALSGAVHTRNDVAFHVDGSERVFHVTVASFAYDLKNLATCRAVRRLLESKSLACYATALALSKNEFVEVVYANTSELRRAQAQVLRQCSSRGLETASPLVGGLFRPHATLARLATGDSVDLPVAGEFDDLAFASTIGLFLCDEDGQARERVT